MQTLQLLWNTSPAIAIALAVQFVTGIYCVFSEERKFKMSHGYGRMKHWRSEYKSVKLSHKHNTK